MSDKSRGLALMKEYASKRKRALNKRDEEKITNVIECIARLAQRNNTPLAGLATRDKAGWEVVYERISNRLRSSDITINLSADNWFGHGKNEYPTYATTYQRNVTEKDGRKVLKTQYDSKGGISEAAHERMGADRAVTLPADWKDADRLHPQRRRLYKAMATGGNSLRDYQSVDLEKGKNGYEIDNRRFNPNAKQVFAALNYGRRPHGASNYYGHSYIVLKSELKRDAIYFPGDTFTVAMETNAVERQCSFETIGAVLAYCHEDMAQDIWMSCFANHTCGDTPSMRLLLEAHVFAEVKMSQHVESLYLSRQGTDGKDGEASAVEWEFILQNAREWARRNNVRFMQ